MKNQIGKWVKLNRKFYRPTEIATVNNVPGVRYAYSLGQIVEALPGGGAAIKFNGYPNKVDYSAREVAAMKEHNLH